MNKSKRLKYFLFFSILSGIIIWTIIVDMIGAEEIVEMVGAHNSYLILFLIASFGGVSTLTAASFYTALFTLASGGLNPVLLGLIGGAGVTIGDSLFFYLGIRGRHVAALHSRKFVNTLSNWIQKRPDWEIRVFSFVYAGFTPFPNDILTAALGFSDVAYRKIILPIMSANMISVGLVAYFLS